MAPFSRRLRAATLVSMAGWLAAGGARADSGSADRAGARAPAHLRTGWQQRDKLLAPAAGASSLGWAVALSGDTLAASAPDSGPSNSGAVEVFVRSAAGWSHQAHVESPDPQSSGYFGRNVALSGDTLVVGEVNGRTGGVATGAAWVFVRAGATWSLQARLDPGGLQQYDNFGSAVGVSGDTAVVGASGADGAVMFSGRAWAFTRSGSAWSAQAELSPSAPQEYDSLGSAVALDGDTAVVGAEAGLVGPSGYACVFTRSGAAWTEQARLQPGDLHGDDFFGFSVALSGDGAAVGARGQDLSDPSNDNHGAVYVFRRTGSAWSQEARLTAPDGALGASLGWSVAMSGDVVVAGAPAADPPLAGAPGVALVFARQAGAWHRVAKLVPADSAASDYLGTGVAAGNGVVAVGASRADTVQGAHSGAVYAFGPFVKGDFDHDLRTDLVLRHVPGTGHVAWLMDGPVRVGPPAPIAPDLPSPAWQVAGVDDFDGDGWNDLVLRDQASGAIEFWLLNGTSRVSSLPLAGTVPPPLNWTLSATADFDGDQRPDLVWRNETSQRLVIWLMNANVKVGAVIPQPDHAEDANWEVVAAQDYDGDGFLDLLWYNRDSGNVVQWLMDAAVARLAGRFTNPTSAVHSNWRVVAGADFDPGPAGPVVTPDLVWRNRDSGRYVVWFLDFAGNRTAGVFTTPDRPESDPVSWAVVGPR